jgi:glutathione S-transferase
MTLFESLATNVYIAAKAGLPLLPAGDDAARALQRTLWSAAEIEPNVLAWRDHAVRLPATQRDPARAEAAAAALGQRLVVRDTRLAHRPLLLGEAFSIADCNVAGVFYTAWINAFNAGATPQARSWLDRCLSRPAALRVRKLREG